ncbi:hypothetical protein BDQ12DRAFT_689551 [Crucibulum laeve]|uniref:Uncharacterized protein n=1 Tax=Crucibulum laeve TaxID=68775 RepID=A0A5C3LRF7_9AGAR|nr:hypothetical protein BDQ12DRAFT_689551 [Crucibulum laeve]
MLHTPPSWLPPMLEGFISLVFAVKLKDDDVRTTSAASISLPRLRTPQQTQDFCATISMEVQQIVVKS